MATLLNSASLPQPRPLLVLVAAGLSGALVGCGPDCQSSCEKLYSENECNIQVPGISRDDLVSECNTTCENALEQTGEIRNDYKPNEFTPSDKSLTIQNDREAALWMDCVEENACLKLEEGFCSGIGI
jgi:hypothetical protein